MSRLFNGSGDRIVFSRGSAPPDQGPITVAALVRSTSLSGGRWVVDADDGSFQRWGMLTSGAIPFIDNDFGTGGPTLTVNTWYWLVVTKVSGSTVPRWHVKNVTTAGAWTHVDDSAVVSDLTGTATEIIVGSEFGGGAANSWSGQIAALAAWTGVLTDLQVEAACTLSAADLLAAAPGWMIRLNQSSTATTVTDDTAGGGNQTSITGTTVDATEPPGWNYALTITVTPAGITAPVALGTPAVSLSQSISPTGIAVPVALGAPTVGTPIRPAGIAVPVALGVSALGPIISSRQGSWWTLKEIADENRAWNDYERARGPVACPNDGEPLRLDSSGMLHCPFDGWTYKGSGA